MYAKYRKIDTNRSVRTLETLEQRLPLTLSFVDSGAELGGAAYVLVGDLDNDDDIDAFMIGDEVSRVAFNNGRGLFQDSGQVLGGRDPEDNGIIGGQLGDLDLDGDLDVIVTPGDKSFQIWENNGNGRFSIKGHALREDKPNSNLFSSLADVDGDSDLDLILGGWNNELWLNDGEGNFEESDRSVGKCASIAGSCGIAFGDFDGDNDQDIAMMNFRNRGGPIWLNDGTGNFTYERQPLLGMAGNSGFVAEVSDLDNDGDLDVVTGGSTSFLPESGFIEGVLINDGNANFRSTGQLAYLDDDEILWDIALGDIDGDLDVDAVAVLVGGDLQIQLNDGTGTFTSADHQLPQDAVTVSLGDVDNDGDLDAFIVTRASELEEFQREGPLTIWINQSTNFRVAGDSNLDGKFNSADLVHVFQVGEYEDDIANNSTFEDGDWNADGEFNSSDFVFAFITGTYEAAATAMEPAFFKQFIFEQDTNDKRLRRGEHHRIEDQTIAFEAEISSFPQVVSDLTPHFVDGRGLSMSSRVVALSF